MNSVQGHCFCRSVKFEIQFPTEFASHCHCESCRISHGAAFVTWGGVDRNPDSHVSFEEKVPWFHPGDELPKFRAKTDEQI